MPYFFKEKTTKNSEKTYALKTHTIRLFSIIMVCLGKRRTQSVGEMPLFLGGRVNC